MATATSTTIIKKKLLPLLLPSEHCYLTVHIHDSLMIDKRQQLLIGFTVIDQNQNWSIKTLLNIRFFLQCSFVCDNVTH